jgi:hypothetical protein
MYDKIAKAVNEHYNYMGSDREIEAEDVEAYLRYGEMAYLDPHEANMIEDLLEKFL